MRAVVVHGVEIPEALIAQEARNHPAPSIGQARAAAGHALATKALLLHRAAELGLRPEPEIDEDGREETEEAALVRAVLDTEVKIVAPSEAECRRVYQAQRTRFRTPMLYEASHILIEPRSAEAGDESAAHTTVLGLLRMLAGGGISFAALARRYSDCPSRELGGSLGQMRQGDLVAEVEQALLALEPGQVALEPVRSRFGWHLLRLDRRIDGRDLPFELVEERIRLHLESRAWTAAAARYVATLADSASAKGIALRLTEGGGIDGGSACLGDLIGDGAVAERLLPWLASAAPETAIRLQAASSETGSSPAEFVRSVVADFIDRATDEHWTRLISAARDAIDPSQAALSLILKAKLDAECGGCGTRPVEAAGSRRRDVIIS